MLEPIHAALAARARLPREHLVDCGYTDAETLVESAQDYGVHIVGPVAADPSWQAREGSHSDRPA
jgi:transposase